MDFKTIIRCCKNTCISMLAMLTCMQENAIAQSAPCVAETTFLVNIQPKPTPAFSFMASGFSTAFSNASTNSTSYSWSFGDPVSGTANTSTDANPTHNFTSAGSFTVTLTAINGCGSRTITQTVQVVCPTLAVPVSASGPTIICAGQAAMLNTTAGYSYQWLLNGTPVAGGTNATLSANQPGQYSVVATNAMGCTGQSQAISVEVLPLAVPSFSTALNSLNASFTNTSSNSTSYSWNFGDPNTGASNTSVDPNPNHLFSAPGTYTVTLTATNSCGAQSITQIVQPGCSPVSVAATANGPTEICPGASVILAATQGLVGYQWLLGGNPIANANAVNFTASQPGVYFVRAADAVGCFGTSQGISVAMLPVAVPSFSSTTNSLNASFTNTSSNATSYAWNFGDPNSGVSNTSTAANPTHVFSAQGSFTVTLTAYNSCGAQSITQIVQPGCAPVSVAATANGSTEICPGASVILAATQGLVGYQWLLGGNPIANANAASFAASQPGAYTVQVTDAVGCVGTSLGISVVLLPLAVPSFSSTVSAMSATFNNNSVNSTSYTWNFGDPNSGASNTSVEPNPTHLFSAPGTYVVTLTATNACGSQTTTQTVVIACTPPQINISSVGPIQFCAGGSATLQATPTNLAAYQWYRDNLPIPSATGATLSATVAGQYKVLVTDAFGCENASGVLVVVVNPLPSVSISGLNSNYMESDPAVTLIGTPVGGTFSGNGVIGAQFAPASAGVGQHTIYYTYTDGNNCTNKDSVVVIVSPTVSTNSLTAFISQMQVFPNPNQGDFWLKMELSAQRSLRFSLVNALGQTLVNRQEQLPSGQSMLHFNRNELNSGVYFLKVSDGEQHVCLRVHVAK